jgi:hypothetical protein
VLNREFGPGRVLRTKEPEIVQGLPPGLDQQLLGYGGEARFVQYATSQSVLIVPMIAGGSTIGVMTLAFADPRVDTMKTTLPSRGNSQPSLGGNRERRGLRGAARTGERAAARAPSHRRTCSRRRSDLDLLSTGGSRFAHRW